MQMIEVSPTVVQAGDVGEEDVNPQGEEVGTGARDQREALIAVDVGGHPGVHAGTDHADAQLTVAVHQIKGGLHPPVLAAGAVEGQEYHVGHPAQLQHPGAEHAGAVPLPAAPHLIQIRSLAADFLVGLGHRRVKKCLVRPARLQAEI